MFQTSLRGAAAALILCAALPALAQTAPAKAAVARPAVTAKPAAKPAAKPVAKPAAKAAAKPAKVAKKKTPPPPPEPVLADADDAQLAAAERAYLGGYACEFKETVQIEKHPKAAGYIDVKWQKHVFTMKPVLSSTGALRLEDVTGRTLMIQIANKSMLLDTKIGQRILDDCIHAEQARLIEEAKAARINDPEAEAAAAARNGLGITTGTAQ
ncbi:MAG: hypothetical protein QM788_16560 [Roseateles sp.]|uniref:hypothetical protein n=1 Tax=Roseateles sp. TaxID=1971397 RepID=UPI0039EA03DC